MLVELILGDGLKIVVCFFIVLSVIGLIMFLYTRRRVISYLRQNFSEEQLKKWVLSKNVHKETRYAKWGSIVEFSERYGNKELKKRLYSFRTAQLFISDSSIVTLAISILYFWIR